MRRTPFLSHTLLASALVASMFSAACSGEPENTTPVAETQTATTAQPANQPLTVNGCLRAGEATDTFVLTSSQAAEPQGQTTTYELHGALNVDMRSHVGRRVEVSGIVRAQQQIASRTSPAPAQERATGTSGTPTVQTTTEVAIKQLDVSSLKPLGETCEG